MPLYQPDYTKPDPTKNPKYNPLKQFRTYSCHHVLMISNTTDFLTKLGTSAGRGIEIYTPSTTANNNIKILDGAEYVVVVNTMVDSNISFPSIMLHSNMGGTVPSADQTTHLISDNVDMVVREAFGSRFIEFILAACNQLRVSQTQAVCVLKTIFVGHSDTGDVVTLSDYEPFPFALMSVTFSFSSSQTIYTLEAAPLTNGMGNLPTFAITGAPPFNVKGKTVKNFIDTYNQILSKHSANEQAKHDKENRNNTSIRYVITISPDSGYDSSDYTLDEQIHDKNKGTNNEQWQFDPSSSSSVTDNIMSVLGKCTKIQQEQKPSAFINNVAKVYNPVVQSHINQTREGTKTITTIVYKLAKRESIVFQTQQAKEAKIIEVNGLRSDDTQAQLKFDKFLSNQLQNGNIIEFDYIFSGTNDDVLKFDMVFNTGINSMFNNATSPIPVSLDTQNVSSTASTSSTVSQKPVNAAEQSSTTPSHIGQVFATQFTSAAPLKDEGAYTEYQALLRRYSINETLSAELEIMGNPRLYRATVNNPDYLINTENHNSVDYVRSAPMYAKINVYMPQIDPKTGFVNFEAVPEKGFRHPFWFEGIFTIFGITNTFDDGVFKQKLELYQAVADDSIPVFSELINAEVASPSTTSEERSVSPAKKASVNTNTTTSSKCKSRKKLPAKAYFGGDGGTNSSNVAAFLKMIRHAEDTADVLGYSRIVGGGNLPTLEYYPSLSPIRIPRYKISSSAVGAYQIIHKTWIGLKINYPGKFNDFHPDTQDRAAVALIKEKKNCLDLIKNGKIPEAIDKLGVVWASLPSSTAGQSVWCQDYLIELFKMEGGVLNQLQ